MQSECANKPSPPTPIEQFTNRINNLSDQSANLHMKLTSIIHRILGDVEMEQGIENDAPKNTGGEYNNLNYAIAILSDRADNLDSLIQFIEERL